MKINTPKRVKNFEQPSVWLEFSPLSKATNSINLGQGFPDWAPPEFLEKAAIKSVKGGAFSAYTRSAGHPKLVKTIADHYSHQLNKSINENTEVLVTVGATEALFLSIMSFVEKNDEVIIIEPAFDIYFGALEMAEANIKPVSLIPNKENITNSSDLVLDWDCLERTLNHKTKAIILNTPHNPTGKVFSTRELEKLAKLLKTFPDCLVISDEVYEHITYDDSNHTSIASLEGMYERTLSIFSSGKTFSATGWKVGWIIGSEKLIKRLQLCQQWVVFSVSTPHQEAIASALVDAKAKYREFSSYYSWLKDLYVKKRDILFKGLRECGLNPILPQGSFFILCDISNKKFENICPDYIKRWHEEGLILIDENTTSSRDYNFCRQLSYGHKVTSIPVSAFYTKENKEKGNRWVRFAFCKEDEVLLNAIENLKKMNL